MSGTASVPNTFANAVTATGLQLDSNFNTVVAYLNDPTNRNNFAADGGATNTVVLTFAPAVASGYTAGLELAWKWASTNSGAVVLNPNGLGNKNLVNPDGTALQAGQGKAGSIGKAVYDGTQFIFITASAQKPGEAKAWGVFNGTNTGVITAMATYNIGSITRTSQGNYSVSLSVGFATTAWAVLASHVTGAAAAVAIGTTGLSINTLNTAGASVDSSYVTFITFGSQ